MLPADAHGFAEVYIASQRKSGAGNALISVCLKANFRLCNDEIPHSEGVGML